MGTKRMVRPAVDLLDEMHGDKQRAMVEAARELFTTVGYEETTIAMVARRAGVAVGTIYLYFKNKQDLLFAVKGAWERELIDFLARPELLAIPHHKRARPVVEACFELCTCNSAMVQMMGLMPQEVGFKMQHEPGVEAAIQVFMEQGIAAGSFRPVDPVIAAKIAYAMVEDTLQQCFIADGGANQERYKDALVDAFEHWLLPAELLGA